MEIEPNQTPAPENWLPPVLYILGRLILFLALIPDSYTGPGDLPVYQAWGALPGWPYFNYWSEFPPLFPMMNAGLYKLANGQAFLYHLLLAILLALAGAVCLAAFQRIAWRLWGESKARLRIWVFLALLLPLPYTWWYFDLLPLAAMLLAIAYLQEDHPWRSGLAIAVGVLLKWFPGLLLATVWRFRKPAVAGKVSLTAIGLTVIVWAGFYLLSPQMTGASLAAQQTRTSWETAWAILDGNWKTGAFLLVDDRLDPSIAGIPRGNPPVISPLLTLAVFILLGIWLTWKVRLQTDHALLAFLGLTWVVFLAWSPGWSPQWILYLIPLILLTLPFQTAFLTASGLILLTLVEWPTFLAHDFFQGLWLIVPLRLALFTWLVYRWHRLTREPALKNVM